MAGRVHVTSDYKNIVICARVVTCNSTGEIITNKVFLGNGLFRLPTYMENLILKNRSTSNSSQVNV